MNELTVSETTNRGTQGFKSSVSKTESLNLLIRNPDRRKIFAKKLQNFQCPLESAGAPNSGNENGAREFIREAKVTCSPDRYRPRAADVWRINIDNVT
jgi:hypothetical protein